MPSRTFGWPFRVYINLNWHKHIDIGLGCASYENDKLHELCQLGLALPPYSREDRIEYLFMPFVAIFNRIKDTSLTSNLGIGFNQEPKQLCLQPNCFCATSAFVFAFTFALASFSFVLLCCCRLVSFVSHTWASINGKRERKKAVINKVNGRSHFSYMCGPSANVFLMRFPVLLPLTQNDFRERERARDSAQG